MKKQLAIALIVIILSAIGGFAVSFYRIGDIAEEQYYRGAYDVCILFGGRIFFRPPQQVIEDCLQGISTAYETNWYGQDSMGWQWPLPIAESE